MDRERKLLYTVVVLAPFVQALSFYALYTEADVAARTETRVQADAEVNACQKQLVRSWARCESKHIRDQRL